jgi:hypothetical protein
VPSCLPGVPGRQAGPGQATLRSRLLVPVVGPDRQRQRVRMPAPGGTGLMRGQQRLAQPVERLGLAGRIVGLAVQGQRPPQPARGLPWPVLPQPDQAEAGQCPRLA